MGPSHINSFDNLKPNENGSTKNIKSSTNVLIDIPSNFEKEYGWRKFEELKNKPELQNYWVLSFIAC